MLLWLTKAMLGCGPILLVQLVTSLENLGQLVDSIIHQVVIVGWSQLAEIERRLVVGSIFNLSISRGGSARSRLITMAALLSECL